MTSVLPMDLQEWANANEPPENMRFKDAYWSQIIFMRDKLPALISSTYEIYKSISTGGGAVVVSTHTSKSILFPVVDLKHPSGLRLLLRNNTFDWKISVESPLPIPANFGNLFNPKKCVSSTCCEGFPKNRIYLPYGHDHKNFTVELDDNYDLYTFVWIIAESLNLGKKRN